MAKEYVIPITWQMQGFVKIKAETAEEALATVTNADDIPIPADAKYIEGSCQVYNDDINSIELYTDAYSKNDLCYVPEEYGDEEIERCDR
jgi:hypothetical protein